MHPTLPLIPAPHSAINTCTPLSINNCTQIRGAVGWGNPRARESLVCLCLWGELDSAVSHAPHPQCRVTSSQISSSSAAEVCVCELHYVDVRVHGADVRVHGADVHGADVHVHGADVHVHGADVHGADVHGADVHRCREVLV